MTCTNCIVDNLCDNYWIQVRPGQSFRQQFIVQTQLRRIHKQHLLRQQCHFLNSCRGYNRVNRHCSRPINKRHHCKHQEKNQCRKLTIIHCWHNSYCRCWIIARTARAMRHKRCLLLSADASSSLMCSKATVGLYLLTSSTSAPPMRSAAD